MKNRVLRLTDSRGRLSLQEKSRPHGVAVCSQNTNVGVVRPLLQSNRATRKQTITATKGGRLPQPRRRTPHPSCLTAIHLLPLEKAHEESGNLADTHKIHRFLKTGRDRRPRRSKKQTITSTKTAGDEPPPYDVKINFRDETGRPVALQQRTHDPYDKENENLAVRRCSRRALPLLYDNNFGRFGGLWAQNENCSIVKIHKNASKKV